MWPRTCHHRHRRRRSSKESQRERHPASNATAQRPSLFVARPYPSPFVFVSHSACVSGRSTHGCRAYRESEDGTTSATNDRSEDRFRRLRWRSGIKVVFYLLVCSSRIVLLEARFTPFKTRLTARFASRSGTFAHNSKCSSGSFAARSFLSRLFLIEIIIPKRCIYARLCFPPTHPPTTPLSCLPYFLSKGVSRRNPSLPCSVRSFAEHCRTRVYGVRVVVWVVLA